MTSIKLPRRQRLVLKALDELGGRAATRSLAERLSMNANGLSQTLGAMYEHVACEGGTGGETLWSLRTDTSAEARSAKMIAELDEGAGAAGAPEPRHGRQENQNVQVVYVDGKRIVAPNGGQFVSATTSKSGEVHWHRNEKTAGLAVANGCTELEWQWEKKGE